MNQSVRQRLSSALLTVTLVFALLAVYYVLTAGTLATRAFTQSFIFAAALAAATAGVRFWPSPPPVRMDPTGAASWEAQPETSPETSHPIEQFVIEPPLADPARPLAMPDLLPQPKSIEAIPAIMTAVIAPNGSSPADPQADPKPAVLVLPAPAEPAPEPHAAPEPVDAEVVPEPAPVAPPPAVPEPVPPAPRREPAPESAEPFAPDPSAPRELLLELASYWHTRYMTEHDKGRKIASPPPPSASPPAPTPVSAAEGVSIKEPLKRETRARSFVARLRRVPRLHREL